MRPILESLLAGSLVGILNLFVGFWIGRHVK